MFLIQIDKINLQFNRLKTKAYYLEHIMLKFIFWTLIIFLLVRWLLKPFLKFAVMKSAQKMAQNMNQQYNQQQKPRQPEGSIRVDRVPEPKSTKTTSAGSKDEYIDYEELK